MQTYRILCPHCGTKARIAKSIQLAPTYKEYTCQCTNPECGYVWVAGMTPVRALSPSARPDPEVDRVIPVSPHIRRPAPAQPKPEDSR